LNASDIEWISRSTLSWSFRSTHWASLADPEKLIVLPEKMGTRASTPARGYLSRTKNPEREGNGSLERT